MTLLEQVIAQLRAEGRAKVFEQSKPFLMVGKSDMPYAEAAARLGLNEGAARAAVQRLRERYRQLLRKQIARTLTDPADLAEKMRALFRAFGD